MFSEQKHDKTTKLNSTINFDHMMVRTRGVESKSLEVGKSLKIGKNRIKSEKSEFIFLLDFFRLFGNF